MAKMRSHVESVPQVLVVRPGALGDTILSLPLLESIRLQNPAARIVFLGTRPYKDLIPKWAEFQDFDHLQWLWLFAPEDTDPQTRRRSFHRAYVVLNNPYDVIRNLKKAGTGSIFRTPSRPWSGEHVVEHMHRGLGLDVPARVPALKRLASRREKLIWIHPGSGGPGKCVPLDFLIRLTTALGDMTGWPQTITVGEEDAFLKEHAGWKTLTSAPRTRLFEQRPFGELCSALGSASLFIGNDSGVSHLAPALGVPGMVFFVSTDPSQWSPWVPPHQIRAIDLRGEELAGADEAKLASQACDLLDRREAVS